MDSPLEVTFRHMDHSPAVEARVRDEAASLKRFFSRLGGCRVVIEAPHQHRKHGGGYHVGIALSVPGNDIVVNHEPSLHGAVTQSETGAPQKHQKPQPDHKDIYVSIRDAFSAARRQLQDHARILRGDTKSHCNELDTL
ncbi:MAG: HPF/RaiA family ribosome-associated protein [Prosthecobacter sp.]|nr:HPF/RaiA family ribosome-associated protein [Prosthecobacter sp.]